MAAAPALRRRRLLSLGATLVVPVALSTLFAHRGVHMARNLLVPGAGLIDHHRLLGVTFAATGVVATVAWLRWGVDWSVALVIVAAMLASAALATTDVPRTLVAPVVLRSAHEFPLVVLVIGALSWLRSVTGRMPFVRRSTIRRARTRAGLADLGLLPVVDRCRAAAVLALAVPAHDVRRRGAVDAVTRPDVAARARRVGLVARGRVGGDPFRRDHAASRATLMLCAQMDSAQISSLQADCRRAALGVPCSEPGWVRPIDATLVALATRSPQWAVAFDDRFALRRGHRPAWWWTPLGVGAGAMPTWEHAACTAMARAAGWIGDDDWTVLRTKALGAAARGTDHPDDERLIAAARAWLTMVDDPEAARIIARPTVRHDPMAVALDLLAQQLMIEPGHLRIVPDLPTTPPASSIPEGILTS